MSAFRWISSALVVVPLVAAAEAPRPFADRLAQARAHSKDKNWSEAAPLWKGIVADNPVRADFWLELAHAKYEAKDYRASAEAYLKAYELKAGYPAASAYNAACCYGLLGEKEPALKWLKIAFDRGFRELETAQKDTDLDCVRNDPRYREIVMLTDVGKLSRDEGWRHDLKLLAREIRRMHYSPYREFTREQFAEYERKLHEDIPKLSDNQVMARFMRLTRMAGDGHTRVRPGVPTPTLPLQLFHFQEGVFVTAAAPDYADLAGCQITRVAGQPVEKVLSELDAIISRDNLMGVKADAPFYMTRPGLLEGLGLSPHGDRTAVVVRDADGTQREVTVKAVPVAPGHGSRNMEGWTNARKGAASPEPLYLKNRKAPYWFEHLADAKTVYCQYNSVRSDEAEPFDKFCGRLFDIIDKNDVERLVLDMRWNGGGNTFFTKSLIHGLIRCTKINQRGKLFVVIGRNTFSAAQNCTSDIEMHTQATFVGEPTGSSPNFIGETIRVTLPYSKMEASVSDLYWQRSSPMDYRTWIAPQLYAPPTFALYRANRDPAMEAIEAYPKPQ